MNNHQLSFIRHATKFLLINLIFISSAQAAGSAKMFYSENGHYYQRFDNTQVVWNQAEKACEALGAHLATITSWQEEVFIQHALLSGLNNNDINQYLTGGIYDTQNLRWKWVTGEKWSYEFWFIIYVPGDHTTLYLEDVFPYSFGGTWNTSFSTDTQDGYICEWGYNNIIETAMVPDLNNNGSNEIAALWVDYKTGKHTVQIKDLKTGAIINTLTFATSFNPPQGIAVLNDLNGNGTPEIAVLYTPPTNVPTVQIKDAKNNSTVIKTLTFLTYKYKPLDINVLSGNADASSKVVVSARHKTTAKDASQVIDSATGSVLYTINY